MRLVLSMMLFGVRKVKEHKDWLSTVSTWALEYGGLSVLGFDPCHIHIHHPKGRKAKHNKVLIGCWWVLPVPIHLHDVHSNHPLNVTHHRKAFEARYGSESELFIKMLNSMRSMGIEIPFGRDVEEAVISWRR